MKVALGVTGALIAATVGLFVGLPGAQASTVVLLSQDTADFTVLPSNSTVITPASTSGPVVVTEFGSSPGEYRTPFQNVGSGNMAVYNTAMGGWDLPGDNALAYTAIEGGGSATYNLTGTELSLLWGSVDSFNSITFWSGANGTGTDEGTFTGASLTQNGGYGHDLVSLAVENSSGPPLVFDSVVLSSSGNSFEFANLTATPLPAALPLFATGLAAMGLFGRRKRRKAATS